MANKKAADFLVYGKSDLINEIEELFAGQIPKKTIKKIINSYEQIIQNHLLEAAPSRPIQIRPFLGLRLQSSITPAQTKDTIFAENIYIPEKILVKAKSTRYFTRCLNDLRQEN